MHEKFFKVLEADHEKQKEILGSLAETKETAPKTREKLFQELREELVPHVKAEEVTLYPPLLEKKESREAALEGLEEHHVSELVLKELETMPTGEDQWGAKIAVLKELVEHHIEDEESKVFTSAEKVLGHDEIGKIMGKFDQEKQRIRKTLQ